MVKSRTELVASAPDEQQTTLIRTMAVAFAGLNEAERVGIMAEAMGAVSELPEEQRRLKMFAEMPDLDRKGAMGMMIDAVAGLNEADKRKLIKTRKGKHRPSD